MEATIASIVEKTISLALENLGLFGGHNEFTTWTLKIGVRQALYEFRRQRWQNISPVDGFPVIRPSLYAMLECDEFMKYIHVIFKEELTENQRTAIRAMIMLRMPKEDVMKRLGMERHDYFKMIHDARLRLKRRLERDGWLLKRQAEENQSAPTGL